MIKKVVGKKQEDKEMSNISYTLYDNCNICPLRVYVNLICDGNLQSLIIEGEAPEDILKATKSKLIIEFAELSGNVQMLSVNNSIKKIVVYRNEILTLQICANLILLGKIDSALEKLKEFRIDTSDPQKIIKRIESTIKTKIVHLNKELSKYSESTDSDSDKPSSQVYNEQLAYLSAHFKFNINMDITLAQYAAYIKMYNQQTAKHHGKK